MIKCAKCGLPETYETIEFGADGVCNICKAHEAKRSQVEPWILRERAFAELVEQYRGKHPYDCIIPMSGGKDSTYTLWHMMTKYKVKPLVVQFDHMFMRPGVLENNERTFRKLGVEVLHFRPNWNLVRRVMLEALVRKGDFCWHCHTGIFAYPMQVALKEKTPLIIWGEPSTEYTAYYKPGEQEDVDETRFNRFVNLGISAEDMAHFVKGDASFDFRDLAPFTYPNAADLRGLGVRSVCLGSYIPWDVRSQVEIIRGELGWQGAYVEGMSSRYSYEKIECGMQGVRDYIKWLKRGYSRMTQMTAIDIRNGRMSRGHADELISEHEGKRPQSLDVFLEHVGITESEFYEHVKKTVVPPHVMRMPERASL